jgi:hypothetical protein
VSEIKAYFILRRVSRHWSKEPKEIDEIPFADKRLIQALCIEGLRFVRCLLTLGFRSAIFNRQRMNTALGFRNTF